MHLVTLGVTIVTKMGTVQRKNNLGTTLFGKARRGILSLLYGHADEEYYLRQIARATGIGIGPVQRELKLLADSGIIQRRVQGRQVYYQANQKSPIYNELHGLILKTVGVADIIKKALEPRIADIKLALIFGSVAKRTENRFSDMDLLVVGNITFGEVVDLLSPAEGTLNRELNPVVYTLAEFNRRLSENHYFISDILSGDKIFVLGDENELQSLVGKRLAKGT